jgi:hypothetical protein
VEEEIIFFGHRNIRAMHDRTIEITRAKEITLRADCIVGVNANKACADLSDAFKRRLKDDNSFLRISLIIDGYEYEFAGHGNHSILLSHTDDIVLRKSTFVCPRTMAVRCNRASHNIPRSIVKLLKDPNNKGVLRVFVE